MMTNKSAATLGNNKINYKGKNTSPSLSYWLQNHKTACADGLKNLYYAPISNLCTMFILGITLALPLLLYLIVFNVNTNLTSWQHDFYQFNAYINSNSSEQQITDLKNKISSWPEVATLKIISKEAGLKELKASLGLEEALSNIETNPLPTVLVVNLKPKYQNINDIKQLLARSQNLAGVSNAEADIVWLENIVQILKLFTLMIYIFSLALAVAVLLVIGNTLRLMLQEKEREMAIYGLLGATTAYIRRPFLYGGMFYGLFTGVLGLLVANLLFNKLHSMINDSGLLGLNATQFVGFNLTDVFSLLMTCCFLGWLGARLTLYWQLNNLKDNLGEA